MSDMSITDLSWYVSDCTVSVLLRWVICLSLWFIMLCLWLYCISITKMSDMSITVIYHAMSLTTVSVSLSIWTGRSVFRLSVCPYLLVSPPSLDCNGHTSMLSCNYNFPHFDSLVWINPTLTDFGILGSIFCMLKNRQSIWNYSLARSRCDHVVVGFITTYATTAYHH